MIGEVVVMEPTEYQAWLSGGAAEGSLASAGEKLFQDLACNTCHRPDAQGRGPIARRACSARRSHARRRRDGRRRRGLHPRVDPQPAARRSSPAFSRSCRRSRGCVTEEQLLQLIEYVKSLQAR